MKISNCKKNGKTADVKVGFGSKVYVNGSDTGFDVRDSGIYRNGSLMSKDKDVKKFLQTQGVIDS